MLVLLLAIARTILSLLRGTYGCSNLVTNLRVCACTALCVPVVPTFQPASSLTFFQRFLAAEPFAGGPDEDGDREL